MLRPHVMKNVVNRFCERNMYTSTLLIGLPGPANPLTRAVRLQQIYDNRNGKVPFSRATSAEESGTTVKEVTVTNAVAVGMEAGFEAFGVDVKISATYEHTNVRQRPDMLELPTSLSVMHQTL